MEHIPVLLEKVISSLNIKSNGIYLDLTLGRAGHSRVILEKLDSGRLIAFDKDKTAVEKSELILNKISSNFEIIHEDFRFLKRELKKLQIDFVDGILIDLGISSPQIDETARGFSYTKDAELDMRMDQRQMLSAYEIVNTFSEEKLIEIFKNNADVILPQRVAKGILKARPIKTTLELAKTIQISLPAKINRRKNHVKTVFQAIRIAVNDELNALKEVLEQATKILKKEGKLAIISFHSIEDRIVKKFFAGLIAKKYDDKIPIIEEKEWSVKVFHPSKEEITNNPRSKSAKLRVLTKNK